MTGAGRQTLSHPPAIVRSMTGTLLAILDPLDPAVVHGDVTCADLWVLAARVEAATGTAPDHPEALVDQAHADGLLLLDDARLGLRCCPACHRVVAALPLAA